MNAILRVEEWGDHHHPIWLDFLRILVGLILILRGFLFALHSGVITDLVLEDPLQYLTFMGAQYIILFHIAGGILITLGILTRFSALMNLPILISEIFFINLPRDLMPFNSELVLSIALLIVLIVYLIFGDGKFSTDHFVSVHKDIW